jgi:hypothetical protein
MSATMTERMQRRVERELAPPGTFEPKPVAGIDTPRDDDIITPCAGGCGRWMVVPHPRHTTGGRAMNPATGEVCDWKPTPEWVHAEAERFVPGFVALHFVRPGAPASAEVQAEHERIKSLREFVPFSSSKD